MGNRLIGIKVKPALAPGGRRPGIPADGQRLKTTATQVDQVLLQRVDPEGIENPVFGQLTVRAIGGDEELIALLTKPRAHPRVVEVRVIKVRQNGIGAGVGHGMGMLRRLPGQVLVGMATGTAAAAGELGFNGR